MKTFGPGETIQVRLGEEFALSLAVLGASGYEWHVAEAAPGVDVLGSSFATAGGGIGGESQQTIRLRAQQPGAHRVQIICKRPWESQPSASQVVTINVSR